MNRLKRYILLITFLVGLLTPTAQARKLSFDLDSISAMGKFPRFCVNTYRWGCDFFNGYDTTYVAGTGYKFNAKIGADSWLDQYDFILPNNKTMMMLGEPTTSAGIHLQYLAVSVGYDIDVSKLLTGVSHSRRRWRFGFSCMLFNIEAFMTSNDDGVTIRRFGVREDSPEINIPFDGMYSDTWGINAVYYIEHKRYSEAAAFGFSRIQRRSAGSWFAGISYQGQKLNFDFTSLPPHMRDQLPSYWTDFRYIIDTRNYGIRAGYGYNWALPRGWLIGVSESPIVGCRVGFVSGAERRTSFSLYNRARVAFVWNHDALFAGLLAESNHALVSDRRTTFASGIYSVELVFGYRFNLW